jgi:hypothetical protein
MTSGSTTTSSVLGAAFLAAALVLPSVQSAYADAPPERGIVSFKYLDYQDRQGKLGNSIINTISGASGGGSSLSSVSEGYTDRIGVHAYSVMAVMPVAGKWSVGTTYTSDSISGASPTYHSSGLTVMNDLRRALDVQLTRYLSSGNVSVGTSYSSESDYVSRNISLQGSIETEDKNTTLTLGGSLTDDSINPVNNKNVDEKKDVLSGLIGLTKVLTTQDIFQFNLGYTNGHGYYTDPYKSEDNRPQRRNSMTALARLNHHFDDNGTDGTARLSYRYYWDTFGIRAHTLDAEYVQPLHNGWTLIPLLRFYTQNEADFYLAVSAAEKADPKKQRVHAASSRYYTEDQRLSAFGAITMGLKVSKQLNQDWLVDVKYEHYEQRAEWSLSSGDDKGLAPFSARMIQVGLSRAL